MNHGQATIDSIRPILWEYLNRVGPRHPMNRITISVEDYSELLDGYDPEDMTNIRINVGTDVFVVEPWAGLAPGEVALIFRPGDGQGKEEKR